MARGELSNKPSFGLATPEVLKIKPGPTDAGKKSLPSASF
jgi:hypothetical protein